MRHESSGSIRWAFLTVLTCAALCLGVGASVDSNGAKASGAAPQSRGPVKPGLDASVERQLALQVSPFMSDLSLGRREKVDFLLTPALLVQEAISDHVVLTYPEE